MRVQPPYRGDAMQTNRKTAAAIAGLATLSLVFGLALTSGKNALLGAITSPAPIRAAFYYPWYPETWGSGTHYNPTLGLYDSYSDYVIATHTKEMQDAGLYAGISSWWGQGTPTDTRCTDLLAGAGTFKWTLYYEPEGTSNPTSAQIDSDLTYIASKYASNPAYLHVNGKPVLFVYGGAETCSMTDRWKTGNAGRFYLVEKVFAGYAACASQPDSWHQYGPAVAEDHQAGYSFTISPGFWKTGEAAPRLARDINRWKTNVADMKASGEPWQLVTTFNEWGEGTQIEPSNELGTAYLDALAVAPTTSPSLGTTVTPTVTAAPTATITPTSTPSPTTTPTPTPSTGSDPILMLAGDIACDVGGAITTGGCHQVATSALLGPATAVQTLGDNQYDAGSITAFNGSYAKSWGLYKAKTHPGIGNHEGTSATSGLGYCSYFGASAHCSSAGNQNNAAYYSYNIGAWHVIVLDSNCGAGGGCATGTPQYNWLVSDLAASNSVCTLAVWHQPRFSSGSTHGSDTAYQPFWQALINGKADLVMNGHDHEYERFAPQGPTGAASATGLTEIVAGTGGKNLYSFGTVKANSLVRNNTTFGVVRLTLHSTGWDEKFLPEAGKTFTDTSSGICH